MSNTQSMTQGPMAQLPMPNNQIKRIYNLEERTAQFAEKLIGLLKKLPNNPINKRFIERGRIIIDFFQNRPFKPKTLKT